MTVTNESGGTQGTTANRQEMPSTQGIKIIKTDDSFSTLLVSWLNLACLAFLRDLAVELSYNMQRAFSMRT